MSRFLHSEHCKGCLSYGISDLVELFHFLSPISTMLRKRSTSITPLSVFPSDLYNLISFAPSMVTNLTMLMHSTITYVPTHLLQTHPS